MKIAITGPVSSESVAHLLDDKLCNLPKGLPGAQFLATIITYLVEQGHQVSVHTLDRELNPDIKVPVIGRGKQFKIYYSPYRKHSIRFNGKKLGRIVDFFRLERKAIERSIKLDDPDIVHAHWSYEFAQGALKTKSPTLVTCHDSPLRVLSYMPNIYRFGRLLMALRVLRTAPYLTAVSPYLKKELGWWAKSKIQVIANPAPTGVFDNEIGSVDSEKMDRLQIVMINNGWDKRKNVKSALRAFKLNLKPFPNSTLHLYGSGYQKNGPAALWAKKNNLDTNVIFYGLTPNVKLLKALKDATLLLHTALEECCPLVLIEAMTSGLPVLGGRDSGGVPWVLNYGKAGVLVDVNNPQEIADEISKLIKDSVRYSAIRNQAFEYARKHFSTESVAKDYLTYYRQIIAE